MGHNTILEVLSFGQTSTSDTAVTTADAAVAIKTTLNGEKPKFVYIQATESETGSAQPVATDWISVSLAGPKNVGGDPPVVGDVVAGDGIRLLCGSPGVIVQTHGYTHFLVYFPALDSAVDTIDFCQTALENF